MTIKLLLFMVVFRILWGRMMAEHYWEEGL